MSFVALGTLGATALGASATTAAVAGGVAGATAAGVRAMGNDNSAGVRAASEMSMAERAQMGIESKYQIDKINAKTESMMDMATSKGQSAMSNVYTGQEAMAKTGFETNDMAAASIRDTKSGVYADYGTRIDSILRDDELSKTSISLGDQRKSASIEKSLATNLASATSQADTFLEGFTGQSNYKVG